MAAASQTVSAAVLPRSTASLTAAGHRQLQAAPPPADAYPGAHACAALIGADFGGNLSYTNYSDPLNATVECGFATVTGIVVNDADAEAMLPGWYRPGSTPLSVDATMTSPLACQARCYADPSCDFFSYEWELQGNATHGAMRHECFMKDAFEDPLCNVDPYDVWPGHATETWHGESGPGISCEAPPATEMACGGHIGMDFGGDSSYSYVNYTADADAPQVNESVSVSCGFASSVQIVTDYTDYTAPDWFITED